MRGYDAEEWKRVREAGRAAFLFRHGFLGRGLPLGLVTAVVVEAARGGALPEALFTGRFPTLLAFCIGVFTLSGSLAARANWSLHERRHGGS